MAEKQHLRMPSWCFVVPNGWGRTKRKTKKKQKTDSDSDQTTEPEVPKKKHGATTNTRCIFSMRDGRSREDREADGVGLFLRPNKNKNNDRDNTYHVPSTSAFVKDFICVCVRGYNTVCGVCCRRWIRSDAICCFFGSSEEGGWGGSSGCRVRGVAGYLLIFSVSVFFFLFFGFVFSREERKSHRVVKATNE